MLLESPENLLSITPKTHLQEALFFSKKMKAIGVEKYGPAGNLQSREVPKPGSPQGHDLLIR